MDEADEQAHSMIPKTERYTNTLKLISMDEADEQQVHSMIPKTERYTDTLKQALTRHRQKV